MNRGDSEAGELAAFAATLADASGAVLRRYFRQPYAVEAKADASPVTVADRESEQALRSAIEARFPAHGIRGEELGIVRGDAEYLWVLDPIDGTRSFITGKPLFVTLIGLVHAGRPIVGVIDQPISRERWIGAAGRATTFNGVPARTRGLTDLANAALFCTGPEWCRAEDAAAFGRLHAGVGMTQYSADAYAFGLLASGWIDLVVECGLEPHDFVAAIAVVEGAGGVITDWSGAPLDCTRKSNVLAAANAALHTAARQRLNR